MPRRCRGGAADGAPAGPSPAQAWPRPRSGNLEIWEPGNLEIWDPKNPKNKVLKIKICVAQNVGKVWISGKKNSSPPHLGAFQAKFSMGQKHTKNCRNFAYFPWWANGPYSPGLGSSSYNVICLGW